MNVFATYYGMARGMVGQRLADGRSRTSNGASSALLDASKDQVTSVFETLGTTAGGPDGIRGPAAAWRCTGTTPSRTSARRRGRGCS